MSRNILKLLLLPIFCIALSTFTELCWGAEFPTKPIEFVIPYAPGGVSDLVARTFAPKFEKVFKKPVTPENKPGGAGAVAFTLVSKAKPDGHTILVSAYSPLVAVPQLEKVAYDSLKDFTFICHIASQPAMVTVKRDAPWKGIEALLDDAKRNPGKIQYGTYGQHSGGHTAMEAIAKERSIQWVHVPFKGDGPCLTALLGGHVDVAATGSGHLPFVKSGELRPLLLMWGNRSPAFPEVPCMTDIGINSHPEVGALIGIIAPKGLPEAIRKRYEDIVRQEMKSPEVLRMADTLGMDLKFLPGSDFKNAVEKNYKQNGDLLKTLGFK
jgi:tripartite-type tricarboxylate transporter receptor subunit TctC